MKLNIPTMCLWCCLITFPTASDAQTLVGSIVGWPRATFLLRTAGPKLIQENATSVDLFELDLTPYLSFSLPLAPPGYSFQTRPRFVTEDLFDTDPSTIEYLLEYVPDTGFVHGFAIYRTDGTMLFQDFTGNFGYSNGESQYDGSDPFIFNTPNGTFMKVMSASSGGILSASFYLLPGHLPCVDCEGSIMHGEFTHTGSERLPPSEHFTIFPNPAGASTTVAIDLPAGIDVGDLVIYDAQGHEIKRVSVDRTSTSITLDTSVVPAGTYFHQLLTGQGILRGPQLIVVH